MPCKTRTSVSVVDDVVQLTRVSVLCDVPHRSNHVSHVHRVHVQVLRPQQLQLQTERIR